MSKFNSFLTGRFKTTNKDKMNALVERSTSGNLSSFAGIFQLVPISEKEESSLQQLLEKYQTEEASVIEDLRLLTAITSEVKAISSQAVILHGERIKRAQDLLKKYQDGAFSAWLLATYGNRQTPYNFLQYYELYRSLPNQLQGIISEMPRQAIYSLSSRSISQEEKEAFITAYQGENKTTLLEKLRQNYPLPEKDKRNGKKTEQIIYLLKKGLHLLQSKQGSPNSIERTEIKKLIDALQSQLAQME